MKILKLALIVGLIFLIASPAFGVIKTPTGSGQRSSTCTGTYANSQVDTVKFQMEEGIAALTFAAYFADSAGVTSVSWVKVINGTVVTAVAADTLIAGKSYDSDVAGNAFAGTVTSLTAPLGDQIWFIVTYAGSENGVSSATNKYEIIKQFYSKP